MITKTSTQPDIPAVGRRLAAVFQTLLDAIPGAPHSPTRLAERLGFSRVTCSKLLSALKRPTPVELLEAIPGPESLRCAADAAGKLGVDDRIVEQALGGVDAFAMLVRDHFGTRAALNAAIGGESRKLRAKVDQAGRSEVFNGMRKILGVEANTWVTSMLFAPSPEEGDAVAVTVLHGAVGLRRLRSDTQVYFSYGAPYPDPERENGPSPSPISLEEFYTHEPAELETNIIAGQVRRRLVQERLDKRAIMDMLVVSRNPRGSRRCATPDAPLRGVSVFVDVPVRMLICDAIVHRDIFPGCSPELIVFNPGGRGPANPNDPSRIVDRVRVSESVEEVPAEIDRFDVPDVPNYRQMIQCVCRQIGQLSEHFRVYRLQMAYPVQSFQFVIAFRAPQAPLI